jgi:hypothetical protein
MASCMLLMLGTDFPIHRFRMNSMNARNLLGVWARLG